MANRYHVIRRAVVGGRPVAISTDSLKSINKKVVPLGEAADLLLNLNHIDCKVTDSFLVNSLNSSGTKSTHSSVLNSSAINLSIDESGDEGGKTSDLLSAAAGIADVSRPPRVPGPSYNNNRNTLSSSSNSGKKQLEYASELDDNDEKYGSKVMKNESSEQQRSTLGQMAQQVQANARSFNRFSGRQNATERFDYESVDEIVDGDDDDDGADVDICIPGNEHTGRWTRKEHELFLDALKKFGKVRLFFYFLSFRGVSCLLFYSSEL